MCYFDLLMLQPAGGEQPLGTYGEILAFQYAIDFAINIGLMCEQSWTHSCLSVLDLERTMRVSRWLLGLLSDDNPLAFCVDTPDLPAIPEGVIPPPLPSESLSERRTSAIYALTQLDSIIDTLVQKFFPPGAEPYALPAVSSTRHRWDYNDFKEESKEVLERLYNNIPFDFDSKTPWFG
jgi:hypothetical protein